MAPLLIGAGLLGMGCSDSEPTTPPPTPNVLLLTIDSTRIDRLKAFNTQAIAKTPNIEAIAASGITFTNAWAVTPWTAPSVVSIFTGLYPPSHGVIYRDDTTSASMPTIARLLGDRGYRLGNFSFFSGISYFRNLGLPPPPANLGHAHAVKSFREWLIQGESAQQSNAGTNPAPTITNAGPPGERPRQPFFAWIHLVEPHLPYGAPGYQAREIQVPGSTGLEAAQLHAELPVGTAEFADGDRNRLLALYDRDLEHSDQVIGRILHNLEQRGQRDNTVIVLVADHGEELLEHGWVGHASTAIQAKLVPEILRIPMIITGPGVLEGVRTGALVQQVDILPTLCMLLQLPLPEPLDGIALPITPTARKNTRELAYFDSSAAGNLTPVERRFERFQGLTDGRCLMVRQRVPGLADKESLTPLPGAQICAPGELDQALEDWQREQTAQRVVLLASGDATALPSPETLESFVPTISVVHPEADAVLGWSEVAGQLVIEWSGCEAEPWIQYEVGVGPATIRGAFPADSNPMVFGPFPEGFWNDLAAHDPYRFRVLCPAGHTRSTWAQFHLRRD